MKSSFPWNVGPLVQVRLATVTISSTHLAAGRPTLRLPCLGHTDVLDQHLVLQSVAILLYLSSLRLATCLTGDDVIKWAALVMDNKKVYKVEQALKEALYGLLCDVIRGQMEVKFISCILF